MANEKIMNTRIQLKYDSFTNWNNSTVVLKAGEIAIAYLGETVSEQIKGENRPVLFKVGDGVKTFANLPWASALAADVYDWAKSETVVFIDQKLVFKTGDKVNHEVDLSNFITDEELDEILSNYLTEQSVDYGKVTADEGFIEADEIHDTFAIKGEGVVSTKAANDTVTISVDLSDYAKTDDLPDVTASGDSEVILSAEGHHVTGSHATHAAGSAKTASDVTISGNGTVGTINIPKIVTNAAGHVTEISEETVTITLPDVPTLPSVADEAVALSFVTEVDQTDGAVATSKAALVQGDNITLTQEFAGSNITISGKDWSQDIADIEVFETDILTVDKFGGIAAGSDLNGMTTREILNQLLYPYIAFTINSASRSAAAATLENGASQTLSSASISITKKSKPITSVKLMNGSTVLGEKTGSDVAGGGTITFSDLGITVTKSNNPNLKFTVTDGTTSTDKNVGASTFVYPYYMGECAANATIDEALVEGLTKKVESKGNKTVTHSGNNIRMIIAYPKAHGVLKSILDPNNFETIGDYTRSEISITGLDGTAQPYYVYASGAATVNGFKVQYKY